MNGIEIQKKGIGAVILAAGYSSRMGQLKALMPLAGVTMLDRSVLLFQSVEVAPIWVVSGYEKDRIFQSIADKSIQIAYNQWYDKGMFTSIQTGIAAVNQIKPDMKGCFLLPVDFPLVKEATLHQLLKAIDMNPGKWVVPTFHGKKGHPLFVPSACFEEIICHKGSNGLKDITDKYRDNLVRVPVLDQGVVLDIDNPTAFDSAEKYIEAGWNTKSLAETAKGRRIVLIRHGQTKQHKGKILLGQTDIPLSETGKHQARRVGIELQKILTPPFTIYTSDLSRARETAEIIGSTFCHVTVTPLSFLREMNLGDWDGMDMEEILNRYPEEFLYRGNHLMEYKKGNRAENFFDLQYRVMEGMGELLERDSSTYLVIVAHQSVLRGISHNFQGKDISEPWTPMKNCEMRLLKSAFSIDNIVTQRV